MYFLWSIPCALLQVVFRLSHKTFTRLHFSNAFYSTDFIQNKKLASSAKGEFIVLSVQLEKHFEMF